MPNNTYVLCTEYRMKRMEENMMTKEEAIQNTEYTETELINLALMMAVQSSRMWRDQSDDGESWDHYDNLLNAFSAIFDERLRDGESKH